LICDLPITEAYPSNFQTMLGSQCRGKIALLTPHVKLLYNYLNVCDHNPPTLQTERRHTIAIPRYALSASRGKIAIALPLFASDIPACSVECW